MAVTLTHFGYIKRMPADTYKSQHRGGKRNNRLEHARGGLCDGFVHNVNPPLLAVLYQSGKGLQA